MRPPASLCLLLLAPGCTAPDAGPPPAATAAAEAPAPTAGRRVFAVAAVQYELQGGRSVAQVIAKIVDHVEAAAKAGARLVVFPELTLLDALDVAAPDEAAAVRALAANVTPVLVTTVAQLSRSTGAAVLLGAPRVAGETLRNAAVLVFPDGRQVVQDKLFPSRWERDVGIAAGDELQVFDAPWGRTAITICYDVEFPLVSQALAGAGVEVVLVPSMTESHSGLTRVRWTAQARAVEHHAYVVVACTIGSPSPTWQTYGRSVVISPRDDRFPAENRQALPNRPGMVVEQLDLSSLGESRAASEFFPARDQRGRAMPTVVPDPPTPAEAGRDG